MREAKAIDVEQAKARQKLWTPGKEDAEQRAGTDLDAGKLTDRSASDCYIRQESGPGSERSEDYEPTGTHGGGADFPRGARV